MVFDDCAGDEGDGEVAGEGLVGLEVGFVGCCLVDVEGVRRGEAVQMISCRCQRITSFMDSVGSAYSGKTTSSAPCAAASRMNWHAFAWFSSMASSCDCQCCTHSHVIVRAYLDVPLRNGYATNWSHCLVVLFLC